MEPTRFGIWREGGRCLLYDPDIPSDLLSLWTNPADGKTLPDSLRRGSVQFLEIAGHDYVHRHYFRGGYLSRFIRDDYLWMGLRRSRPWREFLLLEQMKRNGLPVPQPILACVDHARMTYTGDLVTARLPGSNLAQCLSAGLAVDWPTLGRTIRRFHEGGIDHRDLNVYNIVMDEEEVYLLDFDRARERSSRVGWTQRNLSRLKRSLVKSGVLGDLEQVWERLMAGYRSA